MIIKFDPMVTSKNKTTTKSSDDKINRFLHDYDEILDAATESREVLRARCEGALDSAFGLAGKLTGCKGVDFLIYPDFVDAIDRNDITIVLIGRDGEVEYRITAIPSYMVDGDNINRDRTANNNNNEEEEPSDYMIIAYKIDDGQVYVFTDKGWDSTISQGIGITWYSAAQEKVRRCYYPESVFLETLVAARGPISDAAYTDIKTKYEPLIKLRKKMDELLTFEVLGNDVVLVSAQHNLRGSAVGVQDGEYIVYQYIDKNTSRKIKERAYWPCAIPESGIDYIYPVADGLSIDQAVDYCYRAFDKYVPAERIALTIPLSFDKSIFVRADDLDDLHTRIHDELYNAKGLISTETENAERIKDFIGNIKLF